MANTTAQAQPAQQASQRWQIDASHSSVTFGVRHMMISTVRGEFKGFSGEVVFDESAPSAARVSATIEVATINTREEKRDAHLKSADFFDAEKHPTITFVSRSVRNATADGLELVGDLTIRGVTREVVWRVEGPTKAHKDPWGQTRVGATAKAKIKRSDFGITWNAALEAGGVLVGDEVSIEVDVSLVLKA